MTQGTLQKSFRKNSKNQNTKKSSVVTECLLNIKKARYNGSINVSMEEEKIFRFPTPEKELETIKGSLEKN